MDALDRRIREYRQDREQKCWTSAAALRQALPQFATRIDCRTGKHPGRMDGDKHPTSGLPVLVMTTSPTGFVTRTGEVYNVEQVGGVLATQPEARVLVVGFVRED